MANNVFMSQIAVDGTPKPLGERAVYTVDVSCPPTNSAPVYFRVGDGPEVAWLPSEWHNLRRIRLSEITVRGTPGDVVSIVGGTW